MAYSRLIVPKPASATAGSEGASPILTYFSDSYLVLGSFTAAHFLGLVFFVRQIKNPASYAMAGLGAVTAVLAVCGFVLASWYMYGALDGYPPANTKDTRFAFGIHGALSATLVWFGAAGAWATINLGLHTFQAPQTPGRHWSIVALVGALTILSGVLSGFAWGAIEMIKERIVQPHITWPDVLQSGFAVGWIFAAGAFFTTVAMVFAVAMTRASVARVDSAHHGQELRG